MIRERISRQSAMSRIPFTDHDFTVVGESNPALLLPGTYIVLSQHIVDTRSHDIGDTMSHDIVNTFDAAVGDIRVMTNSLTPRVRADIINYDPTQPGALSVTEFCRSLKVSRSVFYKIRTRSQHESTAALHPRSRAPKEPARRYGPDVVNELLRIRKQLKTDLMGLRTQNHPLRSPHR